MPKLPLIYITGIENSSLVRANTKQQYEIKALTDNQLKVQPKTSERYRTITKALAEKCKPNNSTPTN
jgi:hypothetical protein